MMKKNQHVVPTENGRGIKGKDNSRLTKKSSTKAEAVEIARDIAKKQSAELFIHGKDGKIQDRDSYGNAPCPPRDKKN